MRGHRLFNIKQRSFVHSPFELHNQLYLTPLVYLIHNYELKTISTGRCHLKTLFCCRCFTLLFFLIVFPSSLWRFTQQFLAPGLADIWQFAGAVLPVERVWVLYLALKGMLGNLKV